VHSIFSTGRSIQIRSIYTELLHDY